MTTTSLRPSEPASGDVPSGKLTRKAIVSLTVASFIPAAGMATVPLIMLASSGYGSWLSALISMLATISIGGAIVVFARRFVASGSLYSYVGLVFGRWSRYVVGGSLLLGYLAQLSSISLLMGVFAASLLASLGWEWVFQPWPQVAIYAVILIGAASVVYRGLDVSVRVAVTLAAISLPFMFVVVGGSALHTGLDLPQQLSLEGATLPGIFTGLAAGAAFLFGFESSAALAQETKDPKRNIPWAIMSAPLVLGLLYLVTTVLSVPGLMQASDAIAAGVSAPAALAANAGLPAWLAVLTDTVLTVATLAGVIGFLNYGSRFVATLADDQLLPAQVGRIHPRHRTPSTAVLLLSGAALIFLALLVTVFSVPIITLLTALGILIVVCWIFPYIVICAGAMRLLVRERALTVVLASATVIGAATVAWVFLNNILNPPPAPLNLIPYGFLVALAVVVVLFGVVKRNRSSHVEKSEE